ncbi:putative Tape measure protein N-terminal domain-containing protein [Gammaproteobacteria bacterium]
MVSTEKEFDTAQKAIQATAQALGEPLKTVASLYLDLQKGINKLGGTQAEAIQLTGTLSKAFHLSGETAAEAKTQTDAFAKMLLTGSINSVQFNTMLDKSPALAKALADGLGVTTFALKDMATNGELSAAKLTQALLSQKDAVEKGYSQMPLLIGEAFDRVTNRIKNAVGVWLNELASYVLQLAQASGVTDAFSKAIDVLGEHLDTVKTTLKVLAEVGLGALILTSIPAMLMGLGSLGTALAAVGTAITAAFAMLTTSATVAVLALGPVSVAFLALAALVAGWQFGTWLTEQFIAVKVAGLLTVGVLLLGFEQLRYGWDLFQAVFTKDKFSEVAKEHAKRLAEIKESMTVLTQEAVNASKGMTSAMGSAGEAAAAIAKQIEGVKNALKESVTSSIKEIGSVAQKAQTEIEAQDKAIRGLERTIKESLSSIQAVYKMQTEAVKKEYDDQKVSAKSLYDYQKGQLEAYTSNKIALIKTESALFLNMVDTEVAARKKTTEETLRLLGEEIQNVKNAIDRENAEDDRRNIHAVETELKILNNQREKLSEALQSYRSHIDALNAEINRHYAAAAAAEDAKRDLARTTDEKVRNMVRSTMSEWGAYRDKQNEIFELSVKANAALAAGNIEDAKKYANQMMQLATETAKQVTNNGKVVVDQETAVSTSIRNTREAEDLLKKAIEAEGVAHISTAEKAKETKVVVQALIEDTTQRIEKLSAKIKEGMEIVIKLDKKSLDGAVTELQEALEKKQALVEVKAKLDSFITDLQKLKDDVEKGKPIELMTKVKTDEAQTALKAFSEYASENDKVDLDITIDKAIVGVDAVGEKITKLNELKVMLDIQTDTKKVDDVKTELAKPTESTHTINANEVEVRARIQSLKDENTSSNHEINLKIQEAEDLIKTLNLVATTSTHKVEAARALADAMAEIRKLNEEKTVSNHSFEMNMDDAYEGFTKMNSTTTQSTHTIETNVPEAKKEIEELDDEDTESEHDVETNAEEARADIKALNGEDTASEHSIADNAPGVLSEILSLNGQNTSSTHTIYVQHVQVSAEGGLIGAVAATGGEIGNIPTQPLRFATGGPVAPFFASMSHGTVPGTGDQDTVPRILDRGSYVVKKAAVRHYGNATLDRLANSVARFASGGSVEPGSGWARTPAEEHPVVPDKPKIPDKPKTNKEVARTDELIDLGQKAGGDYIRLMEKFYGGTGAWGDALAVQKFIAALTKMKVDDTKVLDPMRDTKTLSENQKHVLDSIKKNWNFQITRLNGIGTDKDGRPSQDNEHPGVAYGHDYGIELAQWDEWANEHKELWWRKGGAATDTIPALLTPGEFVINKAAVQILGPGFFDAINQMKAPAQALIEPVKRLFAGGTVAQGFADGGHVSDGVEKRKFKYITDGLPWEVDAPDGMTDSYFSALSKYLAESSLRWYVNYQESRNSGKFEPDWLDSLSVSIIFE